MHQLAVMLYVIFSRQAAETVRLIQRVVCVCLCLSVRVIIFVSYSARYRTRSRLFHYFSVGCAALNCRLFVSLSSHVIILRRIIVSHRRVSHVVVWRRLMSGSADEKVDLTDDGCWT